MRTTNCSSDSSSTESACDKVYVNEPDQAGAAVGAACDWDDDCAASPEGRVECVTRFDEATNGWVGLCQVQIPGKEGDGPCASLGSFSDEVPARVRTCEGPLYCEPDGRVCAPRGEVGAACSYADTESCVETAYCDISGACAARAAFGESCSDARCVLQGARSRRRGVQ